MLETAVFYTVLACSMCWTAYCTTGVSGLNVELFCVKDP